MQIYQSELIETHKKSKEEIQARLREFKSLEEKKYLKEFLFCILTPGSRAEKCWAAVDKILELKHPTQNSLALILKKHTRFHNNKARYTLAALELWPQVKIKLNSQNALELRNYLAATVDGYGLKEASHFLRNIGKSNNRIAILDRHILKNLVEAKIIPTDEIKSKKNYLEIEQKYLEFAKSINIPADELDILLWAKEHGSIFK